MASEDVSLDNCLKSIDKLQKETIDNVEKCVNASMVDLATHVKQDLFFPAQIQSHFGSSHPDGMLYSRSGQLRQSVHAVPAKYDSGVVVGRMVVGTKYASVHFGKRNSEAFEITSNRGGYLAIPLEAALDGRGSARMKPREFQNTFIAKGVIFQNQGKGKNKKIVPLFLLRKSVKVKPHIYTEDLVEYAKVNLDKDLKATIK